MAPSGNLPIVPLHISPHEFSRLITDQELTPTVFTTFITEPTHFATLRYYSYVTRTIDRLEKELEIHRREQLLVFDKLFDSQSFRERIQPIVRTHRRRISGIRYHPYSQSLAPPRTPSCDHSIAPPSRTPSSIQIRPEEALARIATSDNSGPLSVNGKSIDERIGSRENPIVIPDDEEHDRRQESVVVSKGEEERTHHGPSSDAEERLYRSNPTQLKSGILEG